MKFSEHYFSDAIIVHPARTREVVARPNIVPLPDNLQGKRLITIVNDDQKYFTFIFDPQANEPMAVMEGDSENPIGTITAHPVMATMLFKKHYTPQDQDEKHPMKYGGEVRIHPPFEGYKEYPQDIRAEFFDDFGSPDAKYSAGATIADKLKKEE
jgi:hypothetical protein